MKSYNAERRFKKAIIFVTAAVRFAGAAKKLAYISKKLSVALNELDVNGDSIETCVDNIPITRKSSSKSSSKSSIFVKERRSSRGSVVQDSVKSMLVLMATNFIEQFETKRGSIPDKSLERQSETKRGLVPDSRN